LFTLVRTIIATFFAVALFPGTVPAAVFNLSKSMQPSTVMPGDTVTVCVTFSSPAGQPEADIQWVLDVTGSMGTGITNIRNNIAAFTGQLSGAGIDYRNGLTEYRDADDIVLRGFAADDAQFLAWVNAVSVSGGGDLAEAGLEAMTRTAAAGAWRAGATRTLILITDAPVHALGFDYGTLSLTGTAAGLFGQGHIIHVISPSYFSGMPAYLQGDPSRMPPLAGGIGLDYSSGAAAWNDFLATLGAAVAVFTNVRIIDPLPPQLIPVPGSQEGGTLSGNQVTWEFSSLSRGSSVTRCLLTTVSSGYQGSIENGVCAEADGVPQACQDAVPIIYVSPTPTATPSSTVTPTPSFSMTPTISPTFTITPTFTVTPTVTLTMPPLLLTPKHPNPNPARDAVWLPYVLSTEAEVDIKVFNVAGEVVRAFDPSPKPRGAHEQRWDLCNNAGNPVATGVYLYRIRARTRFDEEADVWMKCAVSR
jgi:hypothetical protein